MDSREQMIAHDRSQHRERIDKLKQDAGLGPDFRKINPEPNGHVKAVSKSRTDMAPGSSGTVIRRRRGVPRAIPVVLQSGFDVQTEPADQYQANSSRGDLRPLTPIEEELRQSAGGQIDPQIVEKAKRQRFAIANNSKPK